MYMRAKSASGKLSLSVIAGTYVVLLGFDIDPELRPGLMGFAVRRKDPNPDKPENAEAWLCGKLHFPGSDKQAGEEDETNLSPIQKFRWADYTVHNHHTYTYRVEALYGTLGDLHAKEFVEVTVTTEDPWAIGAHGHQIHFNRSAAASQAYVTQFGDKDPEDVPDGAAYKWLSRGLEESLVAFIEQARDSTYELHLCVYEFQKDNLLQAIKAAIDRGVKVQLTYDAIVSYVNGEDGKPKLDPDGTKKEAGPRKKNEAAMTTNGLRFGALDAPCRGRTGITAISHNKFIVLSKADAPGQPAKPIAVWTGSTNFTDGAIYGQANVGHAIANPALAQQYLDLHLHLWNNPTAKEAESRKNAETLSPVPPTAQSDPLLYPIFSPRTKTIAIDECVNLINNAKDLVCLTAPFPLHPALRKALEDPTHPCLKFALLNADNNLVERVSGAPPKPGSIPKTPEEIPDNLRYAGAAALNMKARVKPTALDVAQVKMLQGDTPDDALGGFKTESLHHQGVYIHAKVILIDPLSDHPVVVTGSANFSSNSSLNNDENQLFIHDEKEVAQVYLGEFMRLYDHYAFRDFMAHNVGVANGPHLSTDGSWVTPYFIEGEKLKDRLVFSGS